MRYRKVDPEMDKDLYCRALDRAVHKVERRRRYKEKVHPLFEHTGNGSDKGKKKVLDDNLPDYIALSSTPKARRWRQKFIRAKPSPPLPPCPLRRP